MSYTEYLTELLRPLGVYDMEGGKIQLAELAGQGSALDDCSDEFDRIAKEMILFTAENEGLTAIENLLPHRPVVRDVQRRRSALAALLRIGEDSFTLQAINDNLAGCGLNAKAAETDQPGHICVSFPDVPGIPDGYAEMRKIIEEILPAHLSIQYVFWYVTWKLMEQKFPTWSCFENGYDWESLEKMVR